MVFCFVAWFGSWQVEHKHVVREERKLAAYDIIYFTVNYIVGQLLIIEFQKYVNLFNLEQQNACFSVCVCEKSFSRVNYKI